MNTRKAMRTEAPPEVCAALGLDRRTTLGAVVEHLMRLLHERRPEANETTASGKAVKEVPYEVKSMYGGYDGGAVMSAVAMLKLRMHCDADLNLLCDMEEVLRKSGLIPPEQELRPDEKHAVEEFGAKIKQICAVADEQRAREPEPDSEPEPPKRLN
jgi:hypothetical protein